MSDLISTQEAVVKIVDTAMRKIMSGEQKLTKEYEQSVIEAVDVILNTARCEIVRCKECKYAEHWYRDKVMCFLWHETGIDVFNDGFCNYAERITDE